MPSKNALFNLILLTTSLLFSLASGEMVLRLLGYAGAPESIIGNARHVDDAVLNWRFEPHSVVRDGKIVYHYNSAGFRDDEHALAKPSGVTRIVVVGDSVTEGSGVEQDVVFAKQLQTLFGPKYEVINLGMSGLNTPQEIHLLEVEGLKYGPEVVVVNFVLNDCDFFSNLQAAERYEKEKDTKIGLMGNVAIDPRVKRFLKSSALIHMVKGRVEYLMGLLTGKEEKNYYSALWDKPECHKRVTDGFDTLQKLQQQRQFDVHLLIWPLLLGYDRYEFNHVHKWVAQVAQQRGFQILDLLPVYSTRRYRDLQVTAEDNVHPNGEGHRLSAQAYFDWSRQSSSALLAR